MSLSPVEELLIQLFQRQPFLDAAPDLMADHQAGELLAVDQHDALQRSRVLPAESLWFSIKTDSIEGCVTLIPFSAPDVDDTPTSGCCSAWGNRAMQSGAQAFWRNDAPTSARPLYTPYHSQYLAHRLTLLGVTEDAFAKSLSTATLLAQIGAAPAASRTFYRVAFDVCARADCATSASSR